MGLAGAARVVHRVTGFRGFFQGLTARILYQAPSTAVAWSVYELFKSYLMTPDKDADDPSGTYETIADLRPIPTVNAEAPARSL